MGWELELTDAVYNNDLDLVRQYLQSKEVKKSLGEKSRKKKQKQNFQNGVLYLWDVSCDYTSRIVMHNFNFFHVQSIQCLGFIAKSKLRKKFISYVRRCLPFLACPWKRGKEGF